MSLAEMLVAMTIMAIILVVFLTIFSSVQSDVSRQDVLNRSLQQARLALEQLDREIRSGNVLYDPAMENAPAGEGGLPSCSGCLPMYTLRVYTQSNKGTAQRPQAVCALWTIDDGGNLLTRTWPQLDPSHATAWRLIATGIQNRTLGEPAFELDPNVLYGNRTLIVRFAVNSNPSSTPSQTVRIDASLTGRNTSYGYPTDVCANVPS